MFQSRRVKKTKVDASKTRNFLHSRIQAYSGNKKEEEDFNLIAAAALKNLHNLAHWLYIKGENFW